jgi:hypothetical protein
LLLARHRILALDGAAVVRSRSASSGPRQLTDPSFPRKKLRNGSC